MRAPVITEIMRGDGLAEWETQEISVKDPPFLAKGDGVTDDTLAIQNAIYTAEIVSRKVVVPDGNYRLTSPLIITSSITSITINGIGRNSVLEVEHNGFCFVQSDEAVATGGLIISDLAFNSDISVYTAGGISLISILRGVTLEDLWFNDIKFPINLGNRVWGAVTLNKIRAYILGNEIAGSIGIKTNGSNAVFGSGIEIIGGWEFGIQTTNGRVVSFRNLNISGSAGDDKITNGIHCTNTEVLNIDTLHTEQYLDAYANGEAPAITLINCENVKLGNINCAAGSIYADNSYVRADTIYFGQANGGFRFLNEAIVSSRNVHHFTGHVTGSTPVQYSFGIHYNDEFSGLAVQAVNAQTWIKGTTNLNLSKTNAAFVAFAEETVDILTGEAALEVTVDTDYQGVAFSHPVLANHRYTFCVKVKIISGADYIEIAAQNNTTLTGAFPYRARVSTTDEWITLYVTAESTTTTIDFKIQVLKSGGPDVVFLLDSYALLCGATGYKEPYLCKETPLSGSDTWDPGNIVDGTEEAKDVAVTGAEMGDLVIAGFSLDVLDLVLNGQVTAANVVTCVLANNTGGAIDLGDGIIYVKVMKK